MGVLARLDEGDHPALSALVVRRMTPHKANP